jgi:RecB family endonuclease NucS
MPAMSEAASTVRPAMRLVVARCEVVYTGRLTATLPEATRLLVFKADGSVLVHDDAGGYKPLNWTWREFRPRLLRWSHGWARP